MDNTLKDTSTIKGQNSEKNYVDLNCKVNRNVIDTLQRLKALSNSDSNAEVFRRALSLYNIILTATQGDRKTLWLRSSNGTLTEIVLV